MSANDGGAENADVCGGTVVLVGGYLLDTVYDIQTFDDLTKDGVLAVEMGRASNGLVGLQHLGGELDATLRLLVESLLYATEGGIAVGAPPDNVKLAGTRALVGVDTVWLAGGSYSPPTVVELGQSELSLYRVVELARTQTLAWLGMPAFGVARLYHKVLDDAMEEQRVVVVLAHQLQEVVTM